MIRTAEVRSVEVLNNEQPAVARVEREMLMEPSGAGVSFRQGCQSSSSFRLC